MDLEKVIRSAVAEAIKSEMQQRSTTNSLVLLSTAQAAEILQVDEETVRRFCRRGKLKYIQVGKLIRIEMRQLEQFIRNNEIG